jgi:hypothetical protein
MSVQIKSLTIGAPQVDNSFAAPNDNFNLIPSANVVFDLYVAKNDTVNSIFKTAIAKSIRLVNTAAVPVKINLYFTRPNASGQSRRRQISPVDLSLGPGFMFIDDDELTLEPGDKIQGKADTANAIQYTISGIERDA